MTPRRLVEFIFFYITVNASGELSFDVDLRFTPQPNLVESDTFLQAKKTIVINLSEIWCIQILQKRDKIVF
jgi:hypothetical protein